MSRPSPLGRPGSRASEAALAVLVLVVAVLSAVAAVLVHDHAWGLVLSWLAGAAALWALPPTWWGRPVFAFGWLLVLVRVLFPRPEGDFLVGGNLSGYLLLASGLAFVGVAAFGVRPGRGVRPGGGGLPGAEPS